MVTKNHKRRLQTSAKEDRLSNLPENLINSILERLPVQDVVRTSILSKKWRYTWTTTSVLVFDMQFSDKFAKNGAFGRKGFIRIINQVLFRHKGPISKFSIHIPNTHLDSFPEINPWMSLLSRNSVRELVLTNSNQTYELPSYVFSCQELRNLTLNNCIFKTPHEFEGFLNLEDLVLKNIDFRANSSGNLVSLPKLKKLSLDTCTNIYNFNIKARKLQTLVFCTCLDAKLLEILDSQCLTLVAIVLCTLIKDSVRVERINLAMLSNLPRKTEIFLSDGAFLKLLSADKIPKRLPHAVNRLKGLWLVYFQLGDLDQLHGALSLLQSSPNLQKLHVKMVPPALHYDVAPTSNHLETPDCLNKTLNRLQIVEIENLEGSGPELFFIKLLLAHSPSLMKLTIRPSGTCDANKRFIIVKDVMRFPRASPKAEIIYLDPRP